MSVPNNPTPDRQPTPRDGLPWEPIKRPPGVTHGWERIDLGPYLDEWNALHPNATGGGRITPPAPTPPPTRDITTCGYDGTEFLADPDDQFRIVNGVIDLMMAVDSGFNLHRDA